MLRKGFIYNVSNVTEYKADYVERCSWLCDILESCLSFTYSSSIQNCQLHNIYDPVNTTQNLDYIFCTSNKGKNKL